jgi:hypothetical protein
MTAAGRSSSEQASVLSIRMRGRSSRSAASLRPVATPIWDSRAPYKIDVGTRTRSTNGAMEMKPRENR